MEAPQRYLVLAGTNDGRTGDGMTYRFRLVEGANTVGSRRENLICLEQTGISKRHAVLRLTKGRLTVEDLASKNGTFVNGRRITQARLEVGDRIAFASFRLRVEPTSGQDGQLAVHLERPSLPGGESGLAETVVVEREGPSSRSCDPPDPLVFPPSWVPGTSEAMTELFVHMRALRRSRLSVLVQGETGVGKEGVARTLHLSSPRAAGPFVAVNCAAIPEALLEAELFGVGAGVATGVDPRPGRFVEAQGGTLFLDEIGDLPVSLQPKLLRVLQEGEVQPLGGRPKRLDVRVLAATHTDFAAALAAGGFRYDLFYRLAGATLVVPPVRQRTADLPGLVTHFMTAAVRTTGKDVRGLTRDAMDIVLAHPWPGNVRQLHHAVQRWVHRCPNHQVVDAALVTKDLRAAAGPRDAPSAAVDVAPGADVRATGPTSDAAELDVTALSSLHLATFEARLLHEALRRTEGNLTHAAAALGLSRQALRRRLDRCGLRPSAPG